MEVWEWVDRCMPPPWGGALHTNNPPTINTALHSQPPPRRALYKGALTTGIDARSGAVPLRWCSADTARITLRLLSTGRCASRTGRDGVLDLNVLTGLLAPSSCACRPWRQLTICMCLRGASRRPRRAFSTHAWASACWTPTRPLTWRPFCRFLWLDEKRAPSS